METGPWDRQLSQNEVQPDWCLDEKNRATDTHKVDHAKTQGKDNEQATGRGLKGNRPELPASGRERSNSWVSVTQSEALCKSCSGGLGHLVPLNLPQGLGWLWSVPLPLECTLQGPPGSYASTSRPQNLEPPLAREYIFNEQINQTKTGWKWSCCS